MNSRFRACVPVLVILVLAPALRAVPQAGIDKSLFVALTDDAGNPVTNFTADDFLIREDGQDRTVVAVKQPASQPISVAVLIDTAQGARVTDAYGSPEEYVRDIRNSALSFAKELLSKSP